MLFMLSILGYNYACLVSFLALLFPLYPIHPIPFNPYVRDLTIFEDGGVNDDGWMDGWIGGGDADLLDEWEEYLVRVV